MVQRVWEGGREGHEQQVAVQQRREQRHCDEA